MQVDHLDVPVNNNNCNQMCQHLNKTKALQVLVLDTGSFISPLKFKVLDVCWKVFF